MLCISMFPLVKVFALDDSLLKLFIADLLLNFKLKDLKIVLIEIFHRFMIVP